MTDDRRLFILLNCWNLLCKSSNVTKVFCRCNSTPPQTLMILLIELTKTTKFHMELEKTVNKWSNPEKKECHLKILQIHKSKDNVDPKQIFRQIRQKKEVRNKFIHALDTQFLPTRIKVAYLKNIVGKTGWTPDEELN